MERLWSPWRLAYLTGTSDESAGCIFCKVSPPGGDVLDASRDDLVLVHGRRVYVILNLYPYINGHLMVVPRRHVPSLAALSTDELNELMAFTRDGELALNE